MKERIIKPNGTCPERAKRVEGLTSVPQTPYPKYGDNFMTEPGNGEQPPQRPISREEATRRIEEAVRKRERKRMEKGEGLQAADSGQKPPEKPPTPPEPQFSGEHEGSREEQPDAASGTDTGNLQSAFKDVRLKDLAGEIQGIAEEGKGVESDFINSREERIYRILDEKDFVDEKERASAKMLITDLIKLRSVSSEDQIAFKRELKTLFDRAGAEFEGTKRFLAEASGAQVRTYEQLERIHGKLVSAFNEDRDRVDNDILIRTKALQDKINQEAKERGIPPRPLSDKERDLLGREHQEKMKALWESRKDIKESLEKNFGSARKGLTSAQQASINGINNIEEKIASLNPETDAFQINMLQKQLREGVLELSQPLAPENEPLPDEILIAIGRDKYATEEFIDRLTRLPQEGKPYHLPGFYSDINLTKFLKLNEDLMKKEDLEHVSNVVAATEVIHEMNRILRTSVDQFAQASQNILATHLTTLFQIPGVQDVYGLYEGIIKENQSINRVFTEQVYDSIDTQVEREFSSRREKRIVRDGKEDYLLKSFQGGVGDGRMEDWEKKRAFIFGRNLQRTLLREGDHISISSLPQASEGDARSTFISYAQNQLLNIFNPATFTIAKFKPGESQGGVEMLEEYLKEEEDKRRYGRDDNDEATKGIVGLKVVQGAEVKNIETTTLIGTRGNMMTWRGTDAGLLEFAMVDNGKQSSIKQFFADHSKEIGLLKSIDSKNRWESEFRRTKGDVDGVRYDDLEKWKRARIEKVFGPLLNENAVALGVLVSSVPLPGGVPTEVKKMLWEKIADLNPDTMASILTRLEVDKKADSGGRLENVKSLEEILFDANLGTPEQRKNLRGPKGEWRPRLVKAEMEKLDKDYRDAETKMNASKKQKDIDSWTQKYEEISRKCDVKRAEFKELEDQVKGLLKCEQWTTLRGKLRTIHALRMEDEVQRISAIKNLKQGETVDIHPAMALDVYFSDKRLLEEDRLTEVELNVVKAISGNGKEIAQDLANIKRAHVWFLEDTPTALMKWENLGQSFYRMITDFSQMGQTANEMNGLLLDPFKMETGKALEHWVKMIQGSGSVLGIEDVQDRLFGLVMMWNRYQRIKPEYRQKFVEMLRSGMEKPISIAQEVSRDIGAGAWDEDAAHAVLLTQNHLSIMRQEDKKTGKTGLFEKANKILQCGLFDRLVKSKARDWLILFLLGFAVQLFKETASAKSR